MDEENEEQPERPRPSDPASSWLEPEANGSMPPAPAQIAGAAAPEFVAASDDPSERLEPNQPLAVPSWGSGWSPDARSPGQPGEPDPGTPGEPLGTSAAQDPWNGVVGQDLPPGSSPYGYPPYGYPPGGGGYGHDGYGHDGYGHDGYGHDGYGLADEPSEPQRPRGRKVAALVVAVLVIAGTGAGAGIAYSLRQNQGATSAGLAASPAGASLTTGQIAAAVDPAVVDINTNLGEGTGMIATSNGEIITNNHVVEGATTISVVIANRGTYTATVVGTDAPADVAVLQVNGVSGLPTVKFGNSSSLRIGNSIVAIGNALGRGGTPKLTTGTISALDRTITASDQNGVGATLSETLTGMIQMNASIEPGNSGGPLVNSSGDVIGMNTAAASVDGSGVSVGFALPINRVLQVANEIEQGKAGPGIVIGVQAFLGIEGVTIAPSSGVGLEYVVPGSPADRAGIQQGDVIVAFNGQATPTIDELAALIHKLRPGDRATVTFKNPSGGTQTVPVTLAAGPPA